MHFEMKRPLKFICLLIKQARVYILVIICQFYHFMNANLKKEACKDTKGPDITREDHEYNNAAIKVSTRTLPINSPYQHKMLVNVSCSSCTISPLRESVSRIRWNILNFASKYHLTSSAVLVISLSSLACMLIP